MSRRNNQRLVNDPPPETVDDSDLPSLEDNPIIFANVAAQVPVAPQVPAVPVQVPPPAAPAAAPAAIAPPDGTLDLILKGLDAINNRIGVLERAQVLGPDPNDISLMRESLKLPFSNKKPASFKFPPSDSDKDSSVESDNSLLLNLNRRKPKDKRESNKRESILSRVTAEAENPRYDVVMTQTPPKSDHIRLKYLSLGSVFRFIDSVNEYQLAYGIKLKVPTLIDESVREQLLAHHPRVTVPMFYVMSTSKIVKLLLQEVRPHSALQFRMAIEKNAKFELRSNYKPSASDFKPFYDALLIYRNRVIKVYEICAEDNEDNIPHITNKEGGLVKVFLDAIPHGYGKRVYETMKCTKFESMHDFLRDFYRVVDAHYKYFESAKIMNQHFTNLSFEAPASATRSSRSFQRVNNIAEDLTTSDPDASPQPEQANPELPAEDISESDPEPAKAPVIDLYDSDSAELDQQIAAMSQPVKTAQKLNASSNLHVGKDKPNGCYQLLFYGNCNKGDKCTYSHDYKALAAAHSYYSELLTNSKFRPKGPSARNTLSVMLEDRSPADQLVENVLNSASRVDNPESFMARAVHHEGQIMLLGDELLRIIDALFDTGALHGSYISQAYADANQHLLKDFLVKRKNRVRLADNETVLEVNEAYILSVMFVDAEGTRHVGSVLFWVLPECSHDMIIGLPAILRSFSNLHKSMIDKVVDEIMAKCPELHEQDPLPAPETALHHLHHLEHGQLAQPWSFVPEEEAPEDAATDLPCSFTDALHYMEMAYEDAVQEYLNLFDTHVNREFAEQTKIIDLLTTKGVNVFVPNNWEGIRGVPDIELEFKEGLPDRIKPKARPINPKLFANAKKEFDRLRSYFYKESTSPISSCLVIAPKATSPFIRFCGDYVGVNKFIKVGHFPIPNVNLSLEKIIKFTIMLDFDLANSFHQFRLAKFTREFLSIQTLWGQFEPLFMPEGIGPASFILQKYMMLIFGKFSDWCIVIFDNLLVLATDYDDAYRKTEIILDTCIEFNVFLKFSKTWLGFREANFFGYVCRSGSYELSADRKDAIMKFPFPGTVKKMQSFLGTALFFKSFIPHFSSKAAQLYDMVKREFNWNEATWTVDYKQIFEDFKQALIQAMAIHYPNYELDWIVRTDASLFGIGGVLLQVYRPEDATEPVYQPVGFFSEKFSDQATRWSTIEQEAFAVYATVKHFDYYLKCKTFVLETDHNNLVFMEMSAVPKIIRWRVYLQSFTFMIRHIPGKLNCVSDWISRWTERELVDVAPLLVALVEHSAQSYTDPREVLSRVHGGRNGHLGARATYLKLNAEFPGHKIPYAVVAEYVATCGICQKDRLGMVDCIEPIVRHLKPAAIHSCVGIDTLTVTPPDKDGYTYLNVIVNFFTKFTVLTPMKNKDAKSTAAALFNYFCTFGLVDYIQTDPGTEFMNEVVEQLNEWIGVRHRFSLVDRHESNGVEGTNKQILRHLKALVFDERVLNDWVSLLPVVQLIINTTDSSETGVVPIEAVFGSRSKEYFRLPEAEDSTVVTQSYVKWLNENIAHLYELSKAHQQTLVEKRTKQTPPEEQNMYQEGDLVLWQQNPDEPLPTKLSPKFVGPFEVISQYKNDVSCRHINLGYVKDFHVSRLKIFHGTRDDAKKVALIDGDQYEVKRISGYRGDPDQRTTLDFRVEYQDGSIVWVRYCKDIDNTLAFQEFCESRPELRHVLLSASHAKKHNHELRSQAIPDVHPGDTVYVDLRFFGHLAYDQLDCLPDKDDVFYLVEGTYFTWENKSHTEISIKFPVFNKVMCQRYDFVKRYGFRKELPSSGYKIVDSALLKCFPQISPWPTESAAKKTRAKRN
jgi:hypothetical protein